MVGHQCPGIYNRFGFMSNPSRKSLGLPPTQDSMCNRLGLMSNLSHTQNKIISIYFVINDSALFYASDNNMM